MQENCIDLVGRIADRGAEFVPAREWMRICFELLSMLNVRGRGQRALFGVCLITLCAAFVLRAAQQAQRARVRGRGRGWVGGLSVCAAKRLVRGRWRALSAPWSCAAC